MISLKVTRTTRQYFPIQVSVRARCVHSLRAVRKEKSKPNATIQSPLGFSC